MKKIQTEKPTLTKQVLVTALVTILMFVAGFFVGKGLYHIFN